MKNYLKFDKIAILLSKPITTNVIILISIFSRIVQVVFFYNIRIDNSYMYLATQNMLDGNGFATAYVLSNNL